MPCSSAASAAQCFKHWCEHQHATASQNLHCTALHCQGLHSVHRAQAGLMTVDAQATVLNAEQCCCLHIVHSVTTCY
jgi:hypothetical protein